MSEPERAGALRSSPSGEESQRSMQLDSSGAAHRGTSFHNERRSFISDDLQGLIEPHRLKQKRDQPRDALLRPRGSPRRSRRRSKSTAARRREGRSAQISAYTSTAYSPV